MQTLTKKEKRILDNITQQNLQLPYMKLLPKVHKLDHSVSRTNLHKLTGRPIITAHHCITSNPSRLLGTKLDSIISRLERFLFFLRTKLDISFNLQLNRFNWQTTRCQHRYFRQLPPHYIWLHLIIHKRILSWRYTCHCHQLQIT